MSKRSKILIIGTRGSKLARKQVQIFKNIFFQKIEDEIIFNEKVFKTTGDVFLENKLSVIGNKGLFTKEIDQAQLASKVDISIHSLKDLPCILPDGLVIGAYLKREDFRDALVSQTSSTIFGLRRNAVVGTSSLRRETQIKKLRPDIKIKLIRGNIETRIKKVLSGEYDATLLAMAGLKRLNIKANITPIEFEQMIPAIGQGIIAIVLRKNDKYLLDLINKLTDEETEFQAINERKFLEGLDGSCHTPVGGIIKLNKDKESIDFIYMVAKSNGDYFRKGQKLFNREKIEEEIYQFGRSFKKFLS